MSVTSPTLWLPSYWIGQTVESGGGAEIDTPTLSIADAGDGTGATATIAGGTAGATNVVYTGVFSGNAGNLAWTSAGSRTGNGTVSLSLDTGLYLAYVLSTKDGLSAASAPVYFSVTDDENPIHYQCLLAVQARIRALLLDDIAADHVEIRKVPTDRHLSLPGIVVSPARQVMAPAGTNERDDVIDPVAVVIYAADNRFLWADNADDTKADLRKYTGWLERIARAFRHQRLSGVDSIYHCTVEPLDPLSLAAGLQNAFVSGCLLKFVSREPRGLMA